MYIQSIIIASIFVIALISTKNFTDFFIVPKNHFFIFSAGILVFVYGIQQLFKKYKYTLSFNRIDLAVLIFYLYCLVRIITTTNTPIDDNTFIIFTLLILFYFIVSRFVHYSRDNSIRLNFQIILFAILIVCFIQSLYGILQYLGITKNLNPLFKVGGSFGNPGEYSNYLTSVMVFALGIALLLPKEYYRLRIIAAITSVCTFIVLPMTNARTSWIAGLVGAGIILNYKFHILAKAKELVKGIFLRIAIITITLTLTVFAAYYLYHFKKDSAEGRLFIWELCVKMIGDKPIFGWGFSQFPVAHNDYQANYFMEHPDQVKKGYLAGDINFAFNDYLQISTDLGLLGLILFLMILYFALFDRYKPDENFKHEQFIVQSARAALIIIIVSSAFSYPLQSTPTLVSLYFYLAVISGLNNNKIKEYSLSKQKVQLLAILIIIASGYLLNVQYKRYKAEKKWKYTFDNYIVKRQNRPPAMKIYSEMYNILKHNQYFLYNYGAELSVMKNFSKSIEVLSETKKRLNDTDVYVYLGNSYEGLGNFVKAEECFTHASFITPHKLYAKYRLVLIYRKTNRIEKSLQLAKEIVSMPIKIDTDIAQAIKKEMQEYLMNSNQYLYQSEKGN